MLYLWDKIAWVIFYSTYKMYTTVKQTKHSQQENTFGLIKAIGMPWYMTNYLVLVFSCSYTFFPMICPSSHMSSNPVPHSIPFGILYVEMLPDR